MIMQSQAGYAVVITGTLLSMSLQYKGFFESGFLPNQIYPYIPQDSIFDIGPTIENQWNTIDIGEKNNNSEYKTENEGIPEFKNGYKAKIRIKNAGKLQPPQFNEDSF